MSYKLKLSLSFTALFLCFFILIETITIYRYRNNFEEFVRTQTTWTEAYSATLLEDVKLGRLPSIQRKLKTLLLKGVTERIELELVSKEKIIVSGDTQTKSTLSPIYRVLFPRDLLNVETTLTDQNKTVWGTLRTTVSDKYFELGFANDFKVFSVYFLGTLLIFLGLILFFVDKLVSPIVELSTKVKGRIKGTMEKSTRDEVSILSSLFDLYDSEIKKFQTALAKKSEQEGFSQAVAQFAHDIRSPLTALNVLREQLTAIPEDQRVLLRSSINRIIDISNNLRPRSKYKSPTESPINGGLTSRLIFSLIETVISEKRVEFKEKHELEILATFTHRAYHCFAQIDAIEFRRAISNLINNSEEAITGKGKINVSVDCDKTSITVTVIDDGKGIPESELTKILRTGYSFDKAAGTGLGLSHAHHFFSQAGGNMKIESRQNVGTLVSMTLPRAIAPPWHVNILKLKPESTVVIVDDDETIHSVWKSRLTSSQINIKHLYNLDELTEWISKEHKSTNLYLIDQEFVGDSRTGLDVIISQKINACAILTTSHFDEISLQDKCEANTVRLLSKSLAPYITVSTVDDNSN